MRRMRTYFDFAPESTITVFSMIVLPLLSSTITLVEPGRRGMKMSRRGVSSSTRTLAGLVTTTLAASRSSFTTLVVSRLRRIGSSAFTADSVT